MNEQKSTGTFSIIPGPTAPIQSTLPGSLPTTPSLTSSGNPPGPPPALGHPAFSPGDHSAQVRKATTGGRLEVSRNEPLMLGPADVQAGKPPRRLTAPRRLRHRPTAPRGIAEWQGHDVHRACPGGSSPGRGSPSVGTNIRSNEREGGTQSGTARRARSAGVPLRLCVNGGAKLVHPGGAKLVHLTLCGTRCWGVVPVVP